MTPSNQQQWLGTQSVVRAIAVLAAFSTTTGCKKSAEDSPPAGASAPASVPTHETVSVQKEQLYGLELSRDFRITRRFDDTTHLTTALSVAEAAAYFKQHVLVQHVTIDRQHTVFPRAYMKTDPTRRLLRLELSRGRRGTQVRVRDITPPPMTQGLSQQERWEQAGRNPDGSLKDRRQVF